MEVGGRSHTKERVGREEIAVDLVPGCNAGRPVRGNLHGKARLRLLAVLGIETAARLACPSGLGHQQQENEERSAQEHGGFSLA